jgi:hypothetical protein
MHTIRSRFPGEWTCTVCDRGHNGYLATETWWRSAPPKVCWRCVARMVRDAAHPDSAFAHICIALMACGKSQLKAAEIREILTAHSITRKHVSLVRMSACVVRMLREYEAVAA